MPRDETARLTMRQKVDHIRRTREEALSQQERSNDRDNTKRKPSPTPTYTLLDTYSRGTSLPPPCPEDPLPACLGKQKRKNTGWSNLFKKFDL